MQNPMLSKEHHGLMYAVVAALTSAVAAVFVKYTHGISFNTVVFARFLIAFICVMPAIFQGKVHIHWKFLPKHAMRGLTGLAGIYGSFYAITNLPLVNAITLSNLTPLFIPVIVFFWMRMIIPKMRLLALFVGFVGVLMILRPEPGSSGFATVVGVLGAMMSSVAIVGVRQLSKTESTETILAYYFLISILVLFVPMILTWEPIPDLMGYVYLLLVGVFSYAFQYTLTKSLTHAPATKVSSISYLSVVFAGIFGWWLFGEIPTYWVVGGAAVVVLGGIISLFSKEAARKRD